MSGDHFSLNCWINFLLKFIIFFFFLFFFFKGNNSHPCRAACWGTGRRSNSGEALVGGGCARKVYHVSAGHCCRFWGNDVRFSTYYYLLIAFYLDSFWSCSYFSDSSSQNVSVKVSTKHSGAVRFEVMNEFEIQLKIKVIISFKINFMLCSVLTVIWFVT